MAVLTEDEAAAAAVIVFRHASMRLTTLSVPLRLTRDDDDDDAAAADDRSLAPSIDERK
jgi:hypothetical protein